MHFHWQNVREDARGKPRGFPWHGTRARTTADAIAAVVASVMRSRERRGGIDYVPEAMRA